MAPDGGIATTSFTAMAVPPSSGTSVEKSGTETANATARTGPAVEYQDGANEWWIDYKQLTAAEIAGVQQDIQDRQASERQRKSAAEIQQRLRPKTGQQQRQRRQGTSAFNAWPRLSDFN